MTESSKHAALERFLADPTEHIVEAIGAGYAATMNEGRGAHKAVAFLTDRRLYVVGQVFTLDPMSGRFQAASVESAVLLHDVVGVHTHRWENLVAKMIFVMCMFGSVAAWLLFAATFSTPEGANELVVAAALLTPSFGFGALLGWLLTKKDLLLFEHLGGKIAVRVGWYSQADVMAFRRSVMGAVEAARLGGESASPGATKVCEFCAEDVREAAVKCRHCGSELEADSKTDPGE